MHFLNYYTKAAPFRLALNLKLHRYIATDKLFIQIC